MSENINEILETKEDTNKEDFEDGYFSFRKMISVTLIKILFVVFMIAITLSGIVMIFKGTDIDHGGDALIYGGIALLIFGNLFWRIICEGWIVIFSLHETTVSILNELKRKNIPK